MIAIETLGLILSVEQRQRKEKQDKPGEFWPASTILKVSVGDDQHGSTELDLRFEHDGQYAAPPEILAALKDARRGAQIRLNGGFSKWKDDWRFRPTGIEVAASRKAA